MHNNVYRHKMAWTFDNYVATHLFVRAFQTALTSGSWGESTDVHIFIMQHQCEWQIFTEQVLLRLANALARFSVDGWIMTVANGSESSRKDNERPPYDDQIPLIAATDVSNYLIICK